MIICQKFIYFVLIFCPLIIAGEIFSAPDIMPSNHDFLNGGEGWKRYENFVMGDRILKWNLIFESGKAIIRGSDCQPQSRVGFRSEMIPLNPDPGKGVHIYRLSVKWKGEKIHRPGIYFILLSKDGEVFKQGEIRGPGGDFDENETCWFQVTPKDAIHDPSLLVYVFTDGAGVLYVDEVSVKFSGAGKKEMSDDDAILKIRKTETDDSFPFDSILTVERESENLFSRFPGERELSNPLLPGEYRFMLNNDTITSPGSIRIINGYSMKKRESSRFRQFGVAHLIPFWLIPESDPEKWDVIEVTAPTTSTLPGLPPLPDDLSSYFYYYGDYRFGDSEEDLKHDLAEMKMLRESGITGLCIQDDYELGYGGWKDHNKMNSNHLTAISQAYSQAGFDDPLVYGLFAGLDKGRITWDKNAKQFESYLDDLITPLKAAEKNLGAGKLWLAPVDEPNDEERRNLTKETLPLWLEKIPYDLMITCNWKTAGELPKKERLNLWCGFGDFPSFEKARERGISGQYGGLDSYNPPLMTRDLAGIRFWASGMSSQAWWHFCDVSESAETGLDGKKEDYLCIDPESDPERPIISLPFVAVREGLMDLRLLSALNDYSKNHNNPLAKEINAFLDQTRSDAPPTDREINSRNNSEYFHDMRTKMVELWIKTSTD